MKWYRNGLFITCLLLQIITGNFKDADSSFSDSSKKIKLNMDQAYVNVTSCDPISTFFEVHGISKNCYKCPLQKLHPQIKTENGTGFVIDTRWPFEIFVKAFSNRSTSDNCSITYHFGEAGHYTIKIDYCNIKKNIECALIIDVRPDLTYIPILVAFMILLALAFIVYCVKRIRRGYLRSTNFSSLYSGRINPDLGPPTQTDGSTITKPVKRRLRSLDAFRGLSLTIMVFVNFGGGGYWFFEHSKWNGLTVADLVFPWFIFIMGVSLALSFRSLRVKSVGKLSIFRKILRRTVILFALGLLLNKGTDLNYYRIPGVLQRFSFSYFVVATAELFLHYEADNIQNNLLYNIREIVELWKQWIFMLYFLLVYLIPTYVIKVPGCGSGYVGPGGISENGAHRDCTGGMAGYLDQKLFGVNHIYGHPTSKELYLSTVPFDPEGALGAVTSAFLTFLGLQAGKIIVTYSNHIQIESRMITWALVLGFIASGLCGMSKNDGVIPLNKNLWSLSFILVTASMAYALLAMCYFAIDDKSWWNGAPFIYPGMNSILVYCGHEVLHSFFPFNWQLHPATHSKKLAMNVWGVGLWVLIAYYCFAVDFFVKI